MGLRELLDSILPAGTPESVRKEAMEYGRKNPDMSDAEVAELFKPSLKRAVRKAKEKQAETVKETPKNVPTGRMKKYKAEMAYGGMANGKKHMYACGGSVHSKK